LHKDHPDRKSLLRNSIIKLAIVGVAIICAIAFGVTYGLVSTPSEKYDWMVADKPSAAVMRQLQAPDQKRHAPKSLELQEL